MPGLSIIGAGRLGRTLARLAHLSGRYRIERVWSRSAVHAEEAVRFIGAGQALSGDALPPLSDLTLLAVPDDALATMAARLLPKARLRPDAVLFHASGAQDHRVLAVLQPATVQLASFHPAFSFANPAQAVERFAGCLTALEGDERACSQLSVFAEAIGAQVFRLPEGGKLAYHAALSVASNFLVTLTGLAQSLTRQAGIEASLAGALLGPLMRASLENALTLGAQRALTGPIVRGDVATVQGHLSVLPQADERALYLALAEATLKLAGTQLAPDKAAMLAALLARG